MKKVLLGLCLLSTIALGTPRIKIFRSIGSSTEALEEEVNDFIYARRDSIKIIDIRYQSYNVDRISESMDASIVLIYDRK